MRTVLPLAFVALIAASAAAFGIEPVTVGGDFGTAWLKNLPYQPAADTDGNDTGLWSWGSTPRWMNVVNGTVEPRLIGATNTNYTGIAWLGETPIGTPVSYSISDRPVDFLYPSYSEDPWIQAQLSGRVVRTSLKEMKELGYL